MKHTCFWISPAQWLPVNVQTINASLKGVNKKDLINAAGEKHCQASLNFSGKLWGRVWKEQYGVTGCVHAEEDQVRPEEVEWTLPHDLRYCVIMAFEVEHQSHNNYACQNPDILCGLLRNDIKLEIFGHGHLSV